MPITEIFPNPTVKTVIFEVKYPNLFFIESKIGDIQLKLLSQFPDSKFGYRRGILVADVGPENNLNIMKDEEQLRTVKIWQFYKENKYNLNILQNKFDIESNLHKTYNLGDENKFRDVIKFVLDGFLSVIDLPKFNRVGLRYIDVCPIPEKNNNVFSEYYNSVFPISKFPIENATEMFFRTVSKRNEYNIIYREELFKEKEEYKLILDFDAFAENINTSDCLAVTDNLHNIISDEYIDKIKDPVYEYMRRRS